MTLQVVVPVLGPVEDLTATTVSEGWQKRIPQPGQLKQLSLHQIFGGPVLLRLLHRNKIESILRSFIAGAVGARWRVPRRPGPEAPRPSRKTSMKRSSRPLACVLGDSDIIAPLGLAGISSVAVTEPREPARFSRYTFGVLDALDHWTEPEAFVQLLIAWAKTQPVPPVLFYQTDGDLFLVSRHRQALGHAFRFIVPDADLVEVLADKARFQQVAERLNLPVPRARRLTPSSGPGAAGDLNFPLVIKPLTRQGLALIEQDAKAIRVDSRRSLEDLWPRLESAGVDVLAQEMIPGGEDRIESYHAYIDRDGAIVGEFTGVKIRTYPREFGHSTAVRITDSASVKEVGRALVDLLRLKGVVKADFKRDSSGNLHLLEVNPRFNLWHHPGAIAGVNIPALVYADLTAQPRPSVFPPRTGVTWCHPFEDRWAAKASGISRLEWLSWAMQCDARFGTDWKDPMPFLRGMLLPKLGTRLARAIWSFPTARTAQRQTI